MRSRWLALVLVCIASSLHADTSADGASSRFAACVSALETVLGAHYDMAPGQYTDEHYCKLQTTSSSIHFACEGTCIDWSCHTDACTLHDNDVDVTLEEEQAPASPWTIDSRYDFETMWTRDYGAVRARVVRFGVAGQRRRVSASEVHRIERAIDACVAAR